MPTHRYSQGYRAKRNADEPRRIAFDVLTQVSSEGAYANIALPQALRRARARGLIDARDAAFISELVHGTLRAQGRLDWIISRHLTRSLEQTDPMVVDLLRLGAHQILNMRVPDHAAVSATVDVAREHLSEGPTRMVNAVLRALTREEDGAINEDLQNIADPYERLSIASSHPTWMVRAFEDALDAHGYPTEELELLLEGNNEAPIVTLVARPGLVEPADLADEAESILSTRVAPGTVSEYAVLVESGDPALLPSIREGFAGAQDEGSQLSALIAAEAPVEGTDELWLDLCAGPGGKAALLGAIGCRRGVKLIANEVHPHRARLVDRAVRGLDNVSVVSGDGRLFGGPRSTWPLGSFDRVVVDAPCTGMGSLRRRPESRWRRHPEDLHELVSLQRELLLRAVELTRSGGVLTYITCSPHRAETVEQVEWLMSNADVELFDTVALGESCAVEPLNIPDAAGRISGIDGRTLQLWNHRLGTDDMFIAAFQRV